MNADIIKEKIAKAVVKINSLKGELESRNSELDELKNEMNSLKKENSNLKNKLDNLEQEKQQSSENNARAVKEIEDKLSELHTLLEDDDIEPVTSADEENSASENEEMLAEAKETVEMAQTYIENENKDKATEEEATLGLDTPEEVDVDLDSLDDVLKD